jgi:uncharacterized repeat protein (TIGR03803 family)
MLWSFGLNGGVLGFCFALTALALAAGVDVARAGTETVIYSFQNNGADGSGPIGNLINAHGVLYGATAIGGAGSCRSGQGCGTVFSLNLKTGAETVLYSFQNNGADGNLPQAGVIEVKSVLYGTTLGGGAYGEGTAYSIDPSTGAETVLHSFDQNGEDGIEPVAGLMEFQGLLYGTTFGGGAYGYGTVYSIDPSTGEESVLHSFGDENSNDGGVPIAGLIHVHGVLYGTTAGGGDFGGGTVFSIDPVTGAESLIYSFCSQRTSCPDGETPESDLTEVSGMLYGTTLGGGSGGKCGGSSMGCGTVFLIDPGTGAETTLYKFQNNGADGVTPSTGLTNLQGALCGTTGFGGVYGLGTVYSINPGTGAETVLHSFENNGLDAEAPSGDLLPHGNKLYGNALGGGTQSWGAVFKIKPARQPQHPAQS